MHYFSRQCHNVNIPSMLCLFVVDKRGHSAWETPQIAFALQKWLNIDSRRPAMENWHPIRDRLWNIHYMCRSLLKSIGDFFFSLSWSLYWNQFTVPSSSVHATWCMPLMAHTLFIFLIRLWLSHIEPDKVMVWLNIFKSHSRCLNSILQIHYHKKKVTG